MSNQLQNQKSPYLLQHAENPVNWYPWCDAAFEKAHKEDKPIFLSIGYSTCHWCHVMAHESFEDEEVAEILNDHFVSIKVDREERPDIDAVYMAVCQAMTHSGGWPLTIFMTPDQKPFFAGTYYPKHSLYGSTGLCELLLQVAVLWKEQRERLLQTSESITALFQENIRSSGTEPDKAILLQGFSALSHSFDHKWGGFGSAPKFPTPHNLLFLLRYSALEGDKNALRLVEQTLKSMARGGIFDHIGGGFSRYSTDNKWLIPHFEKMLYDNALLAYIYLETYQQTGEHFYCSVAKKTIEYVLRELTDKEGGFYCGQDADSDGIEGKYYALTPPEVIKILGEEDGTYFCEYFHITDGGNFDGKNIPNLIGESYWRNIKIETLCHKMYDYRCSRTSLHKDTKILSSWNSLMIAALAKAAFICSEPSYLDAAKKAQEFLEKHLTDSEGRLFIRYCDGEAAYPGHLDDYAFYAYALLELYQATWETEYLGKAIAIAKQMIFLFSDENNGGFYLYAIDAQQLISRPKEVYDGALPSGNSVAAHVLSMLAALTGEEYWRRERDHQMSFLANAIHDYPAGHCFALLSMCSVLYPTTDLLCISSDKDMPQAMTDILRKKMPPNLAVLFKSPDNSEELARLAPFTGEFPLPENGTLYYICQGNTCSASFKNAERLYDFL